METYLILPPSPLSIGNVSIGDVEPLQIHARRTYSPRDTPVYVHECVYSFPSPFLRYEEEFFLFLFPPSPPSPFFFRTLFLAIADSPLLRHIPFFSARIKVSRGGRRGSNSAAAGRETTTTTRLLGISVNFNHAPG